MAGMKKRRFAAQLTRYGASPSVVEFALFGDFPGAACLVRGVSTCGANRNALLPDAAGRLTLMADDDTLFSIGRAPGLKPGTAFRSIHDPAEYWHFPDSSTAHNQAAEEETDHLALHELLLGRNLRQCFPETVLGQSPTEANCAQAKFLKHLQSGEGRVVVTYAGVSGDSGFAAPTRALLMTGTSRDRLWNSENYYRDACRSRSLCRVVPQLTVTDNVWGTSTAMGLDARAMLPPFLPLFRNQDAVFGLSILLTNGKSYFGHLPWAVRHEPGERRAYSDDAMWWEGAHSPGNVFDPQYPLAGNEVDLQIRWEAMGLRVGLVPQSYIFHYRSVSRPEGLRGNLGAGAYRFHSSESSEPEGAGAGMGSDRAETVPALDF